MRAAPTSSVRSPQCAIAISFATRSGPAGRGGVILRSHGARGVATDENKADKRAKLSYRARGGVDRVVVVFCLSA